MTGPRPIDVFELFELGVFIDNFDRQRAAERGAMPEAREKRDGVGLDPLPAATAIATLAADEFGIDQCLVDGHAGRKPVYEGHESGAVRFSGSPVTKHWGEFWKGFERHHRAGGHDLSLISAGTPP